MVYPFVVKLQRKINIDKYKIQDGGFSEGHQGAVLQASKEPLTFFI